MASTATPTAAEIAAAIARPFEHRPVNFPSADPNVQPATGKSAQTKQEYAHQTAKNFNVGRNKVDIVYLPLGTDVYVSDDFLVATPATWEADKVALGLQPWLDEEPWDSEDEETWKEQEEAAGRSKEGVPVRGRKGKKKAKKN
jgi:hypothetical protein